MCLWSKYHVYLPSLASLSLMLLSTLLKKQTNKKNKQKTHLSPVLNLQTALYKDSVQFSSVAQPCLTLCDTMDCSTPGLPVHHKLPEFTQTYIHGVGDAIQPSHPLLSPSSPALNPSQHQGLFQRVSSSHQVAKVLYKVYKLLHKDYEVPNNSSKFWRLEASFNQDTVWVSAIFFKKWFQEGGSEI